MPADPIAVVEHNLRSSPYAWLGWIIVIASVYLCGLVLSRTSVWIALAPWRRYRGDLWTEKARLSWPGRRLARIQLLLLPLLLTLVTSPFRPTVDLLPRAVTRVTIYLVALAAVTSTVNRTERKVNPAESFSTRFERIAWILILLSYGLYSSAAIVLMAFVPANAHVSTLVLIAIASAAALSVYQIWAFARILRWLGILRPASDRLRGIVTQVAAIGGFHLRGVEQITIQGAHAMAFVSDGRVALSDAALVVLSDEELAVVAAHELAHLSEPPRVLYIRLGVIFLLTLAMTLFFSGILAITTSLNVGLAFVFWSASVSIYWVTLNLYNPLTLRTELRADEIAQQHEAAPGTYARALERLYEANLVPIVLDAKKHTHPELYDRLIAAGAPSSFARPEPPPILPFRFGFLAWLIAIVIGTICARPTLQSAAKASFSTEPAILVYSGAFGANESDLFTLSELASDRGLIDQAWAYQEAARLRSHRPSGRTH